MSPSGGVEVAKDLLVVDWSRTEVLPANTLLWPSPYWPLQAALLPFAITITRSIFLIEICGLY